MKLTQAKLATIKRLLEAGISQQAAARATNINPSTVSTLALVLGVGRRSTHTKSEANNYEQFQ
jgi:hypothetical protein